MGGSLYLQLKVSSNWKPGGATNYETIAEYKLA